MRAVVTAAAGTLYARTSLDRDRCRQAIDAKAHGRHRSSATHHTSFSDSRLPQIPRVEDMVSRPAWVVIRLNMTCRGEITTRNSWPESGML